MRSRREAGRDLPVLVWRFAQPMRVIASAPFGGGIGLRRWAINAQVPSSYSRRDPAHHLGKLAVSLGLAGRGVGMLTAVDVRECVTTQDNGVHVGATVGLSLPGLAAAPDDASSTAGAPGTVNIFATIPERLSDAALVNTVATVAEAKAQALRDLGMNATGTASDAVCVACPVD